MTLWASAVSIASERKAGERNTGKVQGDGRKFLDRLKSYFGSQITSQSLNESTDYSQKPQQKVILFCFDFFIISVHIFLSLIVSSSRRMLPFDV